MRAKASKMKGDNYFEGFGGIFKHIAAINTRLVGRKKTTGFVASNAF